MNDRETRRYDMFGRVQTFGTDNTADFAAGGEAKKRFANIGKIISDLDDAKAAQVGGGSTALEVLFDALRLDLQNITRTASAIAQDEPGFADTFRPPDSPSQASLKTTAAAFLAQFQDAPTDTAPQKAAKTALIAKFVAHELPADFVTNLADDRQAIDDAKDSTESDDSEGVASTAAVGRLIKAGMKEVNYLDAIMHNKYARDSDKLRAWDSASHIERGTEAGEEAGATSGRNGRRYATTAKAAGDVERFRTMDEVPVSIARRFAEAAQHLIPRGAERLANAANHVDSRIGRAGLDALHVAPIDLRQAGQVVLRQSALRSQAVDVFSENGAGRLTHSRNVRHRAHRESGLIVAF